VTTSEIRITYIGGPTALIECGGVRLLTDPTFDHAGSEYPAKIYTLRKTIDPAIDVAQLGRIDAVLLSHDHHADNLDRAGRAMLPRAELVLTTRAGAERLGANARGLDVWESIEVKGRSGDVTITATPARHGPADGDRGPVLGFVIASDVARAIYFSGDTVMFDGVADVARRFDVGIAMLNMGAAHVREVGPAHLTFTATEGVEVARLMPSAKIVPLHFEGWQHFSESRADITRAFDAAGLGDRLMWLEPGRPISL
jgi:L-ascorbate metabolism protein UlaG (beta-lactamase superfamily)